MTSVATAMTHSIEAQGAVPAWIGVMDGNFHIGMPQESIRVLAEDDHAAKASLSNLASLFGREAISRHDRCCNAPWVHT